MYYRNTNSQGNADDQFIFGDPGDKIVASGFSTLGYDSPALFRPSDLTWYISHYNQQGNADRTQTWSFAQTNWIPISGHFGYGILAAGTAANSETSKTITTTNPTPSMPPGSSS